MWVDLVAPGCRGQHGTHRWGDAQVAPIPWREVELPPTKPVRWGVIWDDG